MREGPRQALEGLSSGPLGGRQWAVYRIILPGDHTLTSASLQRVGIEGSFRFRFQESPRGQGGQDCLRHDDPG